MENMDKNAEIIAGLKLCALYGVDNCKDCPYAGRHENKKSCRQLLCMDAAEALALALLKAQAMSEEVEDLANERTDLLNKLQDATQRLAAWEDESKDLADEWALLHKAQRKQTSVCFVEEAPQEAKIEGLQKDVQKLVEAVNFWRDKANYWQGIADGIKWGVHDRFKNADNDGEDAVEVAEDV